MVVKLPEKRDTRVSDSFYTHIIIVSIVALLIFISWFIYRINYVNKHPYNIASGSSQTTSQNKVNVVNMTNKKLVSDLNKIQVERNLGFAILGDLTSKVFKLGGANMYVESPEQVTSNVISFNYTIKDINSFIKSKDIVNVNQLGSAIADSVISDSSLKHKLLNRNGLGLTVEFDIHGNEVVCLFRMSHTK